MVLLTLLAFRGLQSLLLLGVGSKAGCPGHKNFKVQPRWQKEHLSDNCRTGIGTWGKLAAPDLGAELSAHSCELCSESILKFPFPAAFFLQVFNLSLQTKCAVEKKMLITQLLHSVPATEKFMTICPGLDGAASIETLTSLKRRRRDSALQQGTASSPRRACTGLVREGCAW